MAVDAILFDFFGTLIDYQPDQGSLTYPRTHALLQRWGVDQSYDEFVGRWERSFAELESAASISLVEFGMIDAARAFSQACALDLGASRCETLATTFMQEWREHLVPAAGAIPMVKRLAATRKIGIVSNTHDSRMVPSIVAEIGLHGIVSTTILSVDCGRRKPDPAVYQAALDELGVVAERAMFVGDSFEPDYVGPREVGIAAFLIDPGRHHPLPPTHRLGHVTDIEAVIADWSCRVR